jgi:hypothetical protein
MHVCTRQNAGNPAQGSRGLRLLAADGGVGRGAGIGVDVGVIRLPGLRQQQRRHHRQCDQPCGHPECGPERPRQRAGPAGPERPAPACRDETIANSAVPIAPPSRWM